MKLKCFFTGTREWEDFFPEIQRQRSEELRGDLVNARNEFLPVTPCLMTDKKSNVMARSVYVFLKTKADWKMKHKM